MRMSSPAAVVFLCLALAPSLGAQYGEASVAELFDETIGPAGDQFGWSVAALGDVSGDGVIDVAVAAPFAPGGGRVYALSGADGSTLWSRNDGRTSAVLGFALETMDWNVDGTLDLVAAAPFTQGGKVWIFAGADGSTLAELLPGASDSGFGAALATGGDYDGDGVPDLAVGVPFADTPAGTDSGRVVVFARGSTTPWTAIRGPYAEAEFGIALSFAGDTTPAADLRRELVAGCRSATSFFDGFASVHEWNGVTSSIRFVVGGVGMGYNLLGDRIDGGEDVDGDGLDDFLVGDFFHDETEVFSGADGALLHTLDGNGDLGQFGAPHFVADADHDGTSEIAVGGWQSNAGAPDAGRVLVFSGASGALLKSITSTTSQLMIGMDVRDCGDFDGDGRSDLVVGAHGDGFGGPIPGAALVFSGHLPGAPNVAHAAALPSDPLLADVGGDPAAGPLSSSPFEVFDLALDCSGAGASGPFAIRVRSTTLAAPLATSAGLRWIAGPLYFQAAGLHARDVVGFPAVVLPNDPALWGLSFGAQGSCGGRLSNALTQTIGR